MCTHFYCLKSTWWEILNRAQGTFLTLRVLEDFFLPTLKSTSEEQVQGLRCSVGSWKINYNRRLMLRVRGHMGITCLWKYKSHHLGTYLMCYSPACVSEAPSSYQVCLEHKGAEQIVFLKPCWVLHECVYFAKDSTSENDSLRPQINQGSSQSRFLPIKLLRVYLLLGELLKTRSAEDPLSEENHREGLESQHMRMLLFESIVNF